MTSPPDKPASPTPEATGYDAAEPGTYRDEETGKLYNRRGVRRRRAWWRDVPPVARVTKGD